jgi:hypothetical protein
MTVMNNELVLLGEDIRTAREPANPWVTFALVAVGTFMIMLDASIRRRDRRVRRPAAAAVHSHHWP